MDNKGSLRMYARALLLIILALASFSRRFGVHFISQSATHPVTLPKDRPCQPTGSKPRVFCRSFPLLSIRKMVNTVLHLGDNASNRAAQRIAEDENAA
jgi:hypothetical protein